MLKLTNINKIYFNKKDKSKNVVALKNINIEFPRQGFVSILGPSGCGKTTLLNILGGLDTRYGGEFIVDGISTKKFRAKDWDAYRNNHVGFVFQEYNLIPHQNISKNVELVLSIAGASKVQIKQKSKKALADVGLEQRALDNPNKLSGGQKQRVAIARALINDPELILADEPTSALDSKTSAQVMDILKEISKKKLVIMVTHNDELAKKYSSRIIRILDGEIKSDENLEENPEKEEFLKKLPESYKYGKSRMLFKTAAALSFNNLLTKKRRTILTILAGSIGIICLTIILGILRGSTNFAKSVYNTAFTRPLTIRDVEQGSFSFDASDGGYDLEKKIEEISDEEEKKARGSTKIQTPDKLNDRATKVIESMMPKSRNNNLSPEFLKYTLGLLDKHSNRVKGISVTRSKAPLNVICKSQGVYSADCSYAFSEIMYSNSLDSQFEFVGGKGHWPTKKDEVVVVVDKFNNLPKDLICALGLDQKTEIDAEDILGKYIGMFVPHNQMFERVDAKKFRKKAPSEFRNMSAANVPGAIELKVVGVIKEVFKKENAIVKRRNIFQQFKPFKTSVAYSHELAEHVAKTINESDVVREQKSALGSVLSEEDLYKKEDMMYASVKSVRGSKKLKELALKKLGYGEGVHKIRIYMNSPVEDEDKIREYLSKFNEGKPKKDQISFSEKGGYKAYAEDIRRACIAIVLTIGLASLLASLIMVALLEFISVLERVKEIGILRSIGARKKDVSRLFKSEALIIGFFTGIFGIAVASVLAISFNNYFSSSYGLDSGVRLIQIDLLVWVSMLVFSVIVTLLAGLIPAKIAARKDPVKILTGANN